MFVFYGKWASYYSAAAGPPGSFLECKIAPEQKCVFVVVVVERYDRQTDSRIYRNTWRRSVDLRIHF